MRDAHAQHTIFGGHFERRLQILRETLRDHAVDPEVQQAWIDHTLPLRDQITTRQGLGVQGHPARPQARLAPPAQSPDARIKLGKK